MLKYFIFEFSISGVETFIFLPTLVMFIISILTSMSGVSGAFILLPFQMSVLGYTTPGVSATNFVYNIISIPIGICKYIREHRISWSLFSIFSIGTLPGVLIGYYIRIFFLPDSKQFKFFAGIVLGYLAIQTLYSTFKNFREERNVNPNSITQYKITKEKIGVLRCQVTFQDVEYSFSTPYVFIVSLIVGIVGGAYGIGGASFIAPFCINILNFPVYIISGAALFSTWTTSIVAVLLYAFIPFNKTINTTPDWLLGIFFGLGGVIGIYWGTRLQKKVPITIIKVILGLAIAFISISYLNLL